MHLIWILGSKLIRSNNQSSATLWVLRTSLFVFKHKQQSFLMRKLDVRGNTVNMNIPWDRMFGPWLVTIENGLPRSTRSLSCISKDKNNQIPQTKSGNTVQPQSSVQRDDFGFCWTVWNSSLFLTHSTYWNKCTTSKTHNVLPEVDFESSRSPAKWESWNSPSLHIVWKYYPHSNTICIHMCDECKISIDSGVCHKLWSIFVIDRASFFTDHRISSLPIRSKYKQFKTIWEHTCRFHLFLFKRMTIDAWSRYFVELLSPLGC